MNTLYTNSEPLRLPHILGLLLLGLSLMTPNLVLAEDNTAAQASPAEKAAPVEEAPKKTLITVFKSPTCGCCEKWADHLRHSGFQVDTQNMSNMQQVKNMSGVKPELASCHTAVVNGYIIEGHVPAEDIQRLLAEKPDVIGLSAPGMPMGSPGMEGPRQDAYQVLTFDKDGNTAVFAQH